MFEHFLYPDYISTSQLDELLSKGWFRMAQTIFTTKHVMFDNKAYPAIWLRHRLADYQRSSSFQKLCKRNKHFNIDVKPFKLTKAHNNLWKHYKSGINFSPCNSIQELLFGYIPHQKSIFHTYQINIYDNNELIGCSHFDIGNETSMGISAYYNPDYKHHSLGRYLIYLQIELCKTLNMEYYYPGYFVPGYAHLDYKLAIGTECLEYFHHDGNWYDISNFKGVGIPLEMSKYFY